MFTDQSQYPLKSLLMIGYCTSVTQFMQRAKYVAMWLPCLPVINKPHDILQKWITERGNWATEMQVQQRNKK